MKLYLLLFLINIFINSFAQKYSCKFNEIKPSENNEKIPAFKLYEDINEFTKILEEVHVNSYMKIPKEEFYNAAEELKNSKLRCHSSTTFNGDKDMTHVVIPDYKVEQTYEDEEKNIDTILSIHLI